MPQTCSICRHPEKTAIEDLLLRNRLSLRTVAERMGVSPWALHRHKAHLASAVIVAAEIAGADSLLARVEEVLSEVKQIAAAAKKQKDWPAAVSALREVRACLQMVGRISGDLREPATGGAIHLHRHLHQAGSPPRTESELDVEIARQVQQATADFDPNEIARLRLLAARVPALPS